MSRYHVICVCVAITVSVPTVPALGNGPIVGFDGSTVFPIDTEAVQLVREEVFVRLPNDAGGSGSSECRYWLRNLTDRPIGFHMGFVTMTAHQPDGTLMDLFSGASFHVWVDRKEVPHELRPLAQGRWSDIVTHEPDSIPVWHLTIDAEDTVLVSMSHDIGWSGGSEGEGLWLGVTYVARPASLWAGTIDEASIFFLFPGFLGQTLRCIPDSTACYQISISPSGYAHDGNGVRWTFENWEPAHDFSVGLTFED